MLRPAERALQVFFLYLCVEGAVEVYIQNWRCVDELKLSLGRINVFMGPNASGKSSVAYAVYLAARMPQNPAAFVAQLYGYGFDKLARNVGGRAQYPVVSRLYDAEIRAEEGGKLTTSPRGAGEAYLLPARRLAYLHVMLIIHKVIREVMKKPEAFFVAVFASFFAEVLKSLPVVPPLLVFISELFTGSHRHRHRAPEGRGKRCRRIYAKGGAGSLLTRVHLPGPLR